MASVTVPFTGFAFGEYGSQSPFGVGFAIYRQHLLYKGWWTGQNVMRTIDGSLCPSPGEAPFTLTGVPNGKVGGVGFSGDGAYVWFASGTAVYRFAPSNFGSQAVVGYTGALGAYTEPIQWVTWNDRTYAFAYPAGLYRIDHTAATVTAIAGSPAGLNCCMYGDRLVAGSGSRLHYSNPRDFETWGASNYIDVGDSSNIIALRVVRGRLAIAKADQSWWLLSGVPGVNDVLRQVETSLTVSHSEMSVDHGGGVGLVTAVEGTFADFDGSSLHLLPYLQATSTTFSGVPTMASAFRLRRRGEWGFVTERSADPHDSNNGSVWLFRNGAWSRHKRSAAAAFRTGGYSTSNNGTVVFGRGLTNQAAQFSYLYPLVDRPPFTSDTGSTIRPAADCLFTLPEWWSRDASEVAVKSVTVDFLSWNTGDSNPNVFNVNAVAMRTFDPQGTYSAGGGDVSVSPHQTYSEPTAGLSTSGTRKRFTFQYAPSWGNGFRLDFTGLRGVSIEKVVATCDTRLDQV